MRLAIALGIALLSPLARAAPVITVDPTSIDYGTQAADRYPDPRIITVGNTGDAPLDFSIESTISGNPGLETIDVEPPFGPFTLAPGETHELDVSPVAYAVEQFAGSITLASSDPASPHVTITLAANFIYPGLVAMPAAIDFGTQHVPAMVLSPTTITLTNLIDDPLSLDDPGIGGTPGAFAVESPAGMLLPRSSRELRVWYTATEPGLATAQVSLGGFSFGSPAYVALTARGLASWLAATPSRVTFDATVVGETSSAQLVSLLNASPDPQQVAAIAVDDPAFLVTGGEARLLQPGEGVTLTIVFAPSALGAKQAQLAFTLAGASAPELAIVVEGTGVARPPGSQLPPVGTASGCGLAAHRARGDAATLGLIALALIFAARRRRPGARDRSDRARGADR